MVSRSRFLRILFGRYWGVSKLGECENLKGKRFGRLLALRMADLDTNKYAKWICRCDCGNTKIVFASNLKSGHTKSCGCLNLELIKTRFITHGMRNTKTYKSYRNMLVRCLNPNHDNYKLYGGRGVKVCDNWLGSFENFYQDMGERPIGMTLDRIDPDGDYCKENCRWATQQKQCVNRRHNFKVFFDGREQTLPEWSREIDIPLMTLRNRILKLNWSVERALTEKPKRRRKN